MSDTDPRLFCFLDGSRVCGGDCMAYQGMLPQGEEENPYLDGPQVHCVLLRSLEKTGRGTVVLAGVVRKDIIDRKNREADAQRTPKNPPPIPGVT